MHRVHDKRKPVRRHRLALQATMLRRTRAQTNIDPPLRYLLRQAPSIPLRYLNRNLRATLLELANHRRHQILARRRARSDTQTATPPVSSLQSKFTQTLQALKQSRRLRQETSTLQAQNQAPRRPVKKRAAQGLLENTKRVRDRRWRQMQLTRSATHVPSPGHRHKHPQVTRIYKFCHAPKPAAPAPQQRDIAQFHSSIRSNCFSA